MSDKLLAFFKSGDHPNSLATALHCDDGFSRYWSHFLYLFIYPSNNVANNDAGHDSAMHYDVMNTCQTTRVHVSMVGFKQISIRVLDRQGLETQQTSTFCM